ncbi:MAG: SUMF1/EgtB/PvdO family nonheme iron enzyme [Deltaproteobacteria bacterium]|nr:SUMF1/EgtB/PvdO family nonheme iron enzyme [Deltaproteobacteria bacterium]
MIALLAWLPACDKRCPEEMVQLGELCIDRYEASVAADGRARSLPGLKPTVGLTHAQAAAACRSASKRLCYDHEWVAACGGREWPWGSEAPVDGQCPVPNANGDKPLDDLALTGSFPRCGSVEGVQDLYGNAWEWTAPDPGTPSASAKRGGAWYVAGPSPCTGAPFIMHDPGFAGTIAARCCSDARVAWPWAR